MKGHSFHYNIYINVAIAQGRMSSLVAITECGRTNMIKVYITEIIEFDRSHKLCINIDNDILGGRVFCHSKLWKQPGGCGLDLILLISSFYSRIQDITFNIAIKLPEVYF